MNQTKADFRAEIQRNISKYGFHVNSVIGGAHPRVMYTIGLLQNLGTDFVFAGGIFYKQSDIMTLFADLLQSENSSGKSREECIANVCDRHGFYTSEIDETWVPLIAMGIPDMYQSESTRVLQLIPRDKENQSIDLPNMRMAFDKVRHPVWRFLSDDWSFSVPEETSIVVDRDTLLGYAITEVMRWGEYEWEAFSRAGSNLTPDEIYVVPISTILCHNPSTEIFLELEVGKGLIRGFEEGQSGEWMSWG